jgi:GNAT superfamily N-acetyltransferase
MRESFPMPEFQIDAARPSDVPVVHAMIRELAEYERLAHLVVSSEEDLRRALFEDRAAEVVVAREDGVPVAFALFFHNFSTFLGRRGLWLEDLFVRPAFRRRGYGRALLVHLAGIARGRGCGRFEWAVLDWNAPAIAFYQSLGGTLLHDWRITRVTGPALDALAAQPASPAGNQAHA